MILSYFFYKIIHRTHLGVYLRLKPRSPNVSPGFFPFLRPDLYPVSCSMSLPMTKGEIISGWYLHRGCTSACRSLNKWLYGNGFYTEHEVTWSLGLLYWFPRHLVTGISTFTPSVCHTSISLWFVSHNFCRNFFYLASSSENAHHNSELDRKADSVTKAMLN